MRKKLQHDSFPPTTIICYAQAPLIDHPAKAQAVAAELKVWKSWREMRGQDSRGVHVGKKQPMTTTMATSAVRASQPCLNTQAQVTNRMVLFHLFASPVPQPPSAWMTSKFLPVGEPGYFLHAHYIFTVVPVSEKTMLFKCTNAPT